MRRKAFTLIELLVVIAIIAILAAILFPVFAQAKAAAKKSTDMSNTKQLGTAAQIYINDYDDGLISPALRTCNGSDASYRPFGGAMWSKRWRVWPEVIYDYVKNTGIFTSPGRTDQPFYGYTINTNSSNDAFPKPYDAAADTGGGTPPGNWFDGACEGTTGVPKAYQQPMNAGAAQGPATTIWFYDSVSTIWQVTDEIPYTWDALEALANAVKSDPSTASYLTELQVDGSQGIGQFFKTGGSRVDNSTILKEPHRWGGRMNIAWMDGHSSSLKPSQVKSEWWSLEQVPQGAEDWTPN